MTIAARAADFSASMFVTALDHTTDWGKSALADTRRAVFEVASITVGSNTRARE